LTEVLQVFLARLPLDITQELDSVAVYETVHGAIGADK
jgi:hypothetical protein